MWYKDSIQELNVHHWALLVFKKVRAVLVEVISDESHDSELFYLRIDPEKMDNPMYDLISLVRL